MFLFLSIIKIIKDVVSGYCPFYFLIRIMASEGKQPESLAAYLEHISVSVFLICWVRAN